MKQEQKKKTEAMDLIKIVLEAAKNSDIVTENPDETNPLFRERAKEYLEALKEITKES